MQHQNSVFQQISKQIDWKRLEGTLKLTKETLNNPILRAPGICRAFGWSLCWFAITYMYFGVFAGFQADCSNSLSRAM